MKYIFTFLFCFSISLGFSQGKLNRAKQNLSSSKSSSSSSSNSSSSSRSSNAGSTVGQVLAYELIVRPIFFITYKSIFGDVKRTDLNVYPYYNGIAGEYVNFESTPETKDGYDYKKSSITLQSNYYTGSSIDGIQTQINYRFLYVLGVEGSYQYLYENLPNETVNLDIASLMFNYYRVRTKEVTAWWGLGVTRIGRGINELGPAYQLGINVYPVNPISLHMLWKQNFVEGGNKVNEFRVQGRYHFKRSVLYAGYHHHNLGGVTNGALAVGLQYILK